MAGSIALSLTQRYDNIAHLPLNGGKLYFFAAGTDTPQSAYQDINLAIPWPNPITLDSGGNVPQLFFADGYIKFRLTNAAGVVQLAADYVLVLGPTSGGGAAPSVDATTIISTGDLKSKYGTGVLTGFVRLNARTIGSATSGASERANADTQALFEYLWQTDANLAVSTGRGASANADWVANKTIALPDGRGRILAALDDMGNTAAGRLTSSYFGSSGIVLGQSGGFESQTLTSLQLPLNIPINVFDNISISLGSGSAVYGGTTGGVNVQLGGFQVPQGVAPIIVQKSGTVTASVNPSSGGNAHPIVPPILLITNYIKL